MIGRDVDLRAVLADLPAELDWAVLFRIATLRASADDVDLRGAFGLAPEVVLAELTVVALTSRGRMTIGDDGVTWLDGTAGDGASTASLLERFSERLDRLDVADADCIGLGRRDPFPPAAMAVWLDASGHGRGSALVGASPDRTGWELLRAVGASATGETADGDEVTVHFTYSQRTHLEAARLGRYRRSANCNAFFLRHGQLDDQLTNGLVQAAEDRIRSAASRALDDAIERAERARTGDLPPMAAVHADGHRDYGDLVPLGLLRAGVRSPRADDATTSWRALDAATSLRTHLERGKSDGGWPFHTGTVTTGLDTALVLLGLDDDEAVAGLERFRSPAGGYCADRVGSPGPSTVVDHPASHHWHGSDLATTALATTLRARAGLPLTTPISWIEERFEDRGSVFIACPWLLDWFVALALEADAPATEAVRRRLRSDVEASANPDGTYGRDDERILASACATLTLIAVGAAGRTVAMAQLALAEELGRRPSDDRVAIPFSSTLRVDLDEPSRQRTAHRLLRGTGVVAAGGQLHELTTYRDRAGTITAGLVALALSHAADPSDTEASCPMPARAHPRYRCRSVADYVSRFSIPPSLR